MERTGRFVGVGIDVYEGYQRLEHAVAEVKAVAVALGAEFAGEPLLDPDEATAREHLKSVAGCLTDSGPLVLVWCGHGVASGTKLWLQTRDAGGEINAADVIARCVQSGANQLLFIVDTCQAGAGVGEASAVASALLEELPRDGRVWFGILVSCAAADIGARDGAFGDNLLRLLKDGPRSPDMQRRWSRHDQRIRGEDLGQALLEDWTGEDQRPDFLRRGSAWYMLPNPLWDPGAPEEVVEHLLLAARGGTSADERSWFTGREAEVNEVVAWVSARAAGIGW